MPVFSTLATIGATFSTAVASTAGAVGATGTAAGISAANIAAGTQAVGAVAGLGGLGLNAYGQFQQSTASKKAEAARRDQMIAESARGRRRAIREMQVARAVGLSNATAGGAQESSGLYGGLSSATATAGRQIGEINTNTNIGERLFAANAGYSEAKGISAVGGSLNSFGRDLFGAAENIGKLGDTFMNRRLFQPNEAFYP